MKLQHRTYRAHFSDGTSLAVFYNWDCGSVSLQGHDGWHALDEYTTECLALLVESITGQKVRRVVAW